MSSLKPFFTYYGGKWRSAKRYATPNHSSIIEPFAGSAGYSLRYPERKVWLNDLDPILCGVWDYLIHVSVQDILNLPIKFDHVDEINVSQEAKWLIGFCLNKACATPSKSPSAWMREKGKAENQFWGEAIRQRAANQVEQIRHWKITNLNWFELPDIQATWFVDPPYSTPAGRHYKHHDIYFDQLGVWCVTRPGQVIVREQQGATWLPFETLGAVKSLHGTSNEVVWNRT